MAPVDQSLPFGEEILEQAQPAGGPPLLTTAPSSVEITLREKDGQTILHFVNHSPGKSLAPGVPSSAPLWQKAIVFLQRCQNREKSNDQAWAHSGTAGADDGGFIYASSGESKA